MQLPCNNTAPIASAAHKAMSIAAMAIVCWLAVAQHPARGESGQVYQKTDRRNGLDMTIDTRWTDGFGYRPVRITVSPRAVSKADRTLTVEFIARHAWGSDYDLRVVQYIELPAGCGPVEATLSMPQNSPWNQCDLNVIEDGRRLDKLSESGMSFSNRGYGNQLPETLPCLLVVGDHSGTTAPDTSQLADLLPINDYQQRASLTRSPNGNAYLLPTAVSRPLAELPRRWIDYSSLDVVCLSLDELDQLSQKHPESFQAILQWTYAGGNLWVYGVGEDWQGLGELEDLVKLSDDDQPSGSGWRDPSKNASNQWPFFDTNRSNHTTSGGGISESVSNQGVGTITVDESVDDLQQAVRHRTRAKAILLDPPHFKLRQHGLGQIVALTDDNPFLVSNDNKQRAEQEAQKIRWSWLLGEVGRDRWLWYKRHGLSMVQENRGFLDWLIPGVGTAPVTEFCVLITLFVLAIGPVNYWLLRRWGRLYLLVVTIPLGASIVTFTLFGYALLADGLGTRVRVRSVTQLDQTRKQAACWARLSFYSGLAPGRGLTFPEDVAVLPLDRLPSNGYSSEALRRELIWNDDEPGQEQHLVSGWLHSRTPMQLMTVRSRPTDIALKIVASGGPTKTLKASNRLKTGIQQLVVRSAGGDFYWAEGVAADESVELKPINSSEAKDRIAKTFAANAPESLQGGRNPYRSSLFGLSRRNYYYGPSGQTDAPWLRTGLLEKTLAIGNNVPSLEPGSYLAIVDRSPEVVVGLASANEEASFHVILGKYR